MRVLLIGCEYAGKTTLTKEISKWIDETIGGDQFNGWHDHFTLPEIGQHPDPEMRRKIAESVIELLDKAPGFIEQYQRYQFEYHLQPLLYRRNEFMLVDWYFADAVYAPVYYPQIGGHHREWLARYVETDLKNLAPDMVLIMLKASPDTIRERMSQDPHPFSFLKAEDVELILERYQYFYDNSLIDTKLTIDTTNQTVEETLAEFVNKMEPHLQPHDRQRLLVHKALHG